MAATQAMVRVLGSRCGKCGAVSRGWDTWNEDSSLDRRDHFPFVVEAVEVRENLDNSCYRADCDGVMAVETEPVRA